jgi:hypothetical protein
MGTAARSRSFAALRMTNLILIEMPTGMKINECQIAIAD